MRCSVRRNQIVTGERSLIIKQTLITLPFYYYIKYVSEENLLWWKHFFKIWKDGQISFLNIVIPLIILFFISYKIIYSEFIKTEYDEYMVKEYGNKSKVIHDMSLIFGFEYFIFGILGAALVDFILFLLSLFLLSF